MTKTKIKYPSIEGNLQASSHEEDGTVTVYISGDAPGLMSLARLLRKLAKVDQSKLMALPETGASEHIHLEPDHRLAASSVPLVISRLDDKRGKFDETFKPSSNPTPSPITHSW